MAGLFYFLAVQKLAEFAVKNGVKHIGLTRLRLNQCNCLLKSSALGLKTDVIKYTLAGNGQFYY